MDRYTKIVIIILVVAFLMRLSALTYGLPYERFGDEIVQVAAAFTLLQEHTLRANFPFYYLPPLLSYLLAPLFALYGGVMILLGQFHGIAAFRDYVILHQEHFLAGVRLLGAVFGTAGLLVFFYIARSFFSRGFALLALSLLASDFLHLQESVTGRFWIPLTFFVLLGIYAVLQIYEKGKTKWYYVAAFAIGFGFGAGYASLILYPWFWAAHMLKKDFMSLRDKIFEKVFLLSNAFALFLIALFAYSNVYALMRQFGFSAAIFLNFLGISVPMQFEPGLSQKSKVIENLFSIAGNFRDLNPVLFILALYGFFLFLRSQESFFKKFLLIGMPLIYLLGISFIFPFIDHRYMLPVYPLFMIGAIYAVKYIWEQGDRFWRSIAVVLCCMMFAFPIGLDFFYIKLLQRSDTTVQAQHWIASSIPEGSVVISNLPLTNSKSGIEFFLAKNPTAWIDTRDRYLLSLDEAHYPHPNYFVHEFGRTSYDAMKDKPADFIVYVYTQKKQKDTDLANLPYPRELIQTFYPRSDGKDVSNLYDSIAYPYPYFFAVSNLGPYIDVYALKRNK